MNRSKLLQRPGALGSIAMGVLLLASTSAGLLILSDNFSTSSDCGSGYSGYNVCPTPVTSVPPIPTVPEPPTPTNVSLPPQATLPPQASIPTPPTRPDRGGGQPTTTTTSTPPPTVGP
jgi:hypothetical protein